MSKNKLDMALLICLRMGQMQEVEDEAEGPTLEYVTEAGLRQISKFILP